LLKIKFASEIKGNCEMHYRKMIIRQIIKHTYDLQNKKINASTQITEGTTNRWTSFISKIYLKNNKKMKKLKFIIINHHLAKNNTGLYRN
jgi:hypothetical protein